MDNDTSAVPRSAQLLGYAGAIPFIIFSVVIFIANTEWRPICVVSLRTYAACIASFLGAIYWGLEMKSVAPSYKGFVWGIVPSLLATISMLLPTMIGLALITSVLWLCYFVDCLNYPRYGQGHWLRMRLVLTAIASLACICLITIV